MSLPKTLAIILGAGPGTGAALGRAFAASHDVALLARNKASLDSISEQINKNSNNKAAPFACDASSAESISSAFAAIKTEFPTHQLKVAIFNVASPFVLKPFLELTAEEMATGLAINLTGAFHFSQQVIPQMLEAGGGSVIFTGATASLKGGAKFAAFAPSKFALRGLSQSLAREFGPQGIHVSHAIIDGLIDTERVAGFTGGEAKPDSRLKPDAIASAYVHLANQPRSAWTHELDLRPYAENF